MKKVFYLLLGTFLFSACVETNRRTEEPSPQDRLDRISELETQVLGQEDFSADTALMLVSLQESFATDFPEDSLAAILLYKAADIARGAGEPGLAIKLWGKVHRLYPDFKLAKEALFLQAFTFETQIGDINNARIYYENFINRYPNHELADVARMALENLNKDPEELIQKFRQ